MDRELKKIIRPVWDFPKPGVLYWDTAPLLAAPELFERAVKSFANHARALGADCIAAIEAKGFPLGAGAALSAGLPLVLVRKPGLIPGAAREQAFVKEYGEGRYQIRTDALAGRKRAYLIYDILAGPGAVAGAAGLLEEVGGRVVGAGFVVELEYLKGREALGGLSILALVRIAEKKPWASN